MLDLFENRLDSLIGYLVDERTYKQLRGQTSKAIVKRARDVKIKLLTKTKQGRWFFQASTPGSKAGVHKAWIKPAQKGGKLLKDDVIVHCSCPHFKYNLEVSLWKGNASQATDSNRAKPVKTNPGMKKFLCKHLIACFDDLKKRKVK